MEKLILFFVDIFQIIIIGLVLITIIFPIIVRRIRSKSNNNILNKYSVFMDSTAFPSVLLIFFMLLFLVVGFIIIYLSSKEYDKNTVNSIMCMLASMAFIIPPTKFIINKLKETIRILKGEYVIILDEMKDKYYHSHNSSNNRDYWLLYFKDYFKKYNETVTISSLSRGNKLKEGDKCYLVFVKGNNFPYIFECENYSLDDMEADKLKTIDDLKDYIDKKEFVLDKIIRNDKIVINKNTLKKDFTKEGHRKTVIVFLLICIFLFLFLAASILMFESLIASIIVSLVTAFWIFLTAVKLKYVITIYKNIKKGNFKIKEDEVIALNKNIQYSDSNEVTSFKFKNYKKIVYEEKREYHDTQIGDKFYLVFVKGEKEPIKVYNAKNSIIEN